jgi:FMN-dependent NADH-azoreductase
MSTLLYIKASPRGPRSHSIAVAEAFLEAYFALHPDDKLITKNLFSENLPPFDGDVLQAKYNVMHGVDHSPQEAKAWEDVKRYVKELKSCDKLVMAVPMWNYALPYRLKQYIDIIVQPGLTFGYDSEKGYFTLVPDKPTFIAYASGGEYPAGSQAQTLDYQKPYLEMILGFIGLKDIRSVRVEATLMGPETAKARREQATVQALEMVKDF